MAVFLEDKHKKALVRLELINTDTKEVNELGFATKIYIPEEEDVVLITSPSIFPDDIDAHLDEILVHRWKPKPKQKDPVKVKSIESHKQADVNTVVFEGEKKYSLQYKVLTEKEIKQHKKLTACVFEGKKKVELQFENKGGSYKLNVSKEAGYDVKRAKGAPVIIEEFSHHMLGIPRYNHKIVGVLSMNSNGDVYPALFKDGFLGEAESDDRERDHAKDSKMLKEAIKGNTVYQTKIMASHYVTSAKTDEIFTNLTVYYADKKQEKKEQAKDLGRSEQLQEYTKRTMSCKVEKYDDVFIDMKGENPKLLLTGKPGIGKTFLCEKVIRDWSLNRLFQNENTPNIQFAYLLKFRQLSLQGDKKMNLQELLNCSPLLDDNSVINNSLFEYLIQNPSKVLIILDGFDECSEEHRKQITSDYEERYLNNSKEKMPIPALCSKLIRGKVLRNSVVLVSSRPGKAEELGKINFDRYVEISGFSPEQVTEYVDKYFREPEKEQTKKVVREHVEKNENLISFCHIPLLSFLLCWCLEWQITHKGIAENLPAKITDLYDEVTKVLVQKLHANLKYSEMSEYAKKIAEETLNKLAKLAANLLKESKYIFDVKTLDLTEDEIENLKVSGILHCVPGIRISAFETKAEFSFTHLTLQEYLSASFFVKNKEIPEKEKMSGQTFVFMCGLLSKEKDGKQLMNDLIQQVTPKNAYDHVNKLLMLQCLYEYGEQKLTEITINNLYYRYYDSDGVIRFDEVTDADMKYLSYLLDIIRSLKEQHPQSSSVHTLHINDSPLTSFGVGVVCRSLVSNSFITKLELWRCSLNDKCVEKITDSLVNTGITYLKLRGNNITDEGVKSICSVLTQSKITHLDLRMNNITDEGVKSIFSVLTQTKITHLDLDNSITDEGVKSICSVLPQSTITYLDLNRNNIKDEGVKSICNVLTQTKITCLGLGNNNITDEGVKIICRVLTDTKITHLYLERNKITDEGVKSICSVLTQTKITHLYLSSNEDITDEGAESICRVIIQDDCRVKSLELFSNKITVECKKRVELVKTHKPGVRLLI